MGLKVTIIQSKIFLWGRTNYSGLILINKGILVIFSFLFQTCIRLYIFYSPNITLLIADLLYKDCKGRGCTSPDSPKTWKIKPSATLLPGELQIAAIMISCTAKNHELQVEFLNNLITQRLNNNALSHQNKVSKQITDNLRQINTLRLHYYYNNYSFFCRLSDNMFFKSWHKNSSYE